MAKNTTVYWSVVSSLSNIWKDKHLSIPLKVTGLSSCLYCCISSRHGSCLQVASDITTATISFWLHPARRWFQSSPSPVVVILAAPTPTRLSTVGDRAFSGGCKPALEQSVARRHLSSNADCFPEPPQHLHLFLIISFLTVFGCLFCTPCIVVV